MAPGPFKFRSYLLATLEHFLSDERKRAHARKRGGGRPLVPLDEEAAESRYQTEVAAGLTPELAFERHWALALIRRVLDRLEAEQAARGRGAQYAAIRPCLTGPQQEASYAALGAALGCGEGAVKTAVHRLRKDFGRLLRAEVSQTVANPAEVDAELRRLITVTAGVPDGL